MGLEEHVDENKLYLQTVGGTDKWRRIFGIGCLASQVPLITVDTWRIYLYIQLYKFQIEHHQYLYFLNC